MSSCGKRQKAIPDAAVDGNPFGISKAKATQTSRKGILLSTEIRQQALAVVKNSQAF
jgi:hypothetical protein